MPNKMYPTTHEKSVFFPVLEDARKRVAEMDEIDGNPVGTHVLAGLASDIRTVLDALESGLTLLLSKSKIQKETGMSAAADAMVMLQQIYMKLSDSCSLWPPRQK